ncbi:MAG TPA: hypothetical protein PKW95_02740 [bacterium]|nr:hypothetical protein [bacterium]
MITQCPQCRQKVRVEQDGNYRCPVCKTIFTFQHSAPPPTDKPADVLPQCERCRKQPAVAVCAECGLFVCETCAREEGEGRRICHQHSLEAHPVEMFKALARTPVKAYEALIPGSQFVNYALLYGLILAGISLTIQSLEYIILPSPVEQVMYILNVGLFNDLDFNMADSGWSLVEMIALSPLSLLITLIMKVLIAHLGFRLVGTGRKGLTGTFKVVMYAQTTALLAVIPYLGGILYVLGELTYIVIGGAKMHRVSYGRSAAGVLLPSLLFFLALVGAAILITYLFSSIVPSITESGTLI